MGCILPKSTPGSNTSFVDMENGWQANSHCWAGTNEFCYVHYMFIMIVNYSFKLSGLFQIGWIQKPFDVHSGLNCLKNGRFQIGTG